MNAIPRSAGLAALLLLTSAFLPVLPGIAVADGSAAAHTLYVSNGAGAPCSDGGNGAESRPFCSISAAAAAVQPGQTVVVAAGVYRESVDITRSGTASAPITFVANNAAGQTVTVDASNAAVPGNAFSVSGAQNVVIRGFRTLAASKFEDIRVADSSDVTLDQDGAWLTTGGPDLRITGSSHHVTVSRTSVVALRGSGVEIDPGVTGTVVTGNSFWDNVPATPSVLATDAPGTEVTGNTIVSHCAPGISLAGASTGSSVENNIVETSTVNLKGGTPTACATPGAATGITVSSGSVPQTTADYNLTDPAGGGAPYSWAGTGYSTLSSFTAATGQGGHDLAADPQLTMTSHGEFDDIAAAATSPAVDSADAAAPGELPTDFLGSPRMDDPAVADTGSDGGYFDRGAIEVTGGYQGGQGLELQPQGPAHPLTVTLTSTPPTSTWTSNLPITQTKSWHPDDSPFYITTTATSIDYTFHRAGYHRVQIFWGSSNTSTAVVLGAEYTPVPPTRLLDTRTAVGVTTTTPIAPGADAALPIGSLGGIPAADLSAVVANVTVTQPTTSGTLTVSTGPGAQTGTSNLNFTAGETVANLVTVPVGGGTLYFHNGGKGTVHVLMDLQGYYSAGGYGFKPETTPLRVLDTRSGKGAPAKPLTAKQSLVLDLSKQLPSGATAAVLNVTATQPQKSGYITAYPAGQAVPTASSLNFAKGGTVPNLVIVPLVGGKAALYNGSAGTTHLVADLEGYYGSPASGANETYVPYGPTRIADTRDGTGIINRPIGAVAAHDTLGIYPDWYDDCAPICPLAEAQVLNVTVTQPTVSGSLSVWGGAAAPTASNLNFTKGQTVPNLVMVKENGGVLITNQSSGSVQIVVDQEGYFIAPQTWAND